MNSQYLAHLHSLCVLILIAFHICLIIGKPWGHLTIAGKFRGELPVKMKMFSGLSIFILFSVALMVEIGSGNIVLGTKSLKQKFLISAIVFNIIQTILHIITPSKWERILWLPIISIMLICSLMLFVQHS